MLLWTQADECPFENLPSILLGGYPKMDSLDHTVIVFLIFWRTDSSQFLQKQPFLFLHFTPIFNVFLKKIALWKYNWHTIYHTVYSVHVLNYVYICEIISTIKLGNIYLTLKKFLLPLVIHLSHSSLSQPRHPNNRWSASCHCRLACILSVLCKRNHAECTIFSSGFFHSVYLFWGSFRLCCVLIVHSFLLLSGILWYRCIICLSLHLLMDLGVVFSCALSQIKLLRTFVYKSMDGRGFPFLLGKSLETGMKGSHGRYMFNFKETA